LHQRLGARAFIRQRLRRIGLPFLLGMITIVPLVIAITVWGFIREGQPLPAMPGSNKGLLSIPTIHLWFLLYLLYIYALVLAALQLGARVPARLLTAVDRWFDRIIASPWRYIAFAPLTMICLRVGPWWGEPNLPVFSLAPEPWTLAHYTVFFVIGWWLHRRGDSLRELTRCLFPAAFIAGAAFLLTILFKPLETADSMFPNRHVVKTAALFCAAVYAWTMTFALTGFFLRYTNTARPWKRYLADASYWCYLAHLPIVMGLQIISARWPVPAFAKFALLLIVTMALLLITYHWRVRYTWVGNLLNGRRDRPN
jgi:hypothetical protein